MEYFGERWGDVPTLNLGPMVVTPVGQNCFDCNEEFVAGDQGVMIGVVPDAKRPVHRECHLRALLGSIGHLLKVCHCFRTESAGPIEDFPGITRRQNAMLVMAWIDRYGYRP